MEHKFRIQTGPLVRQTAQKSSGQTLAFVHVDNPDQIKEGNTQRKIRRHVMKNISRSRRKDSTCLVKMDRDNTAVAVVGPMGELVSLLPPPLWAKVNVCPNFKRLFLAMDMVSEGLLSLAMGDSAREFRKMLDAGLYNAPQREDEADEAPCLFGIEQYTDSLSLVRSSISSSQCIASRYAVIGTIICLAYFDVRPHGVIPFQ